MPSSSTDALERCEVSVFGKIIDFLLGKNGCDHEKNEQTIRRLKDESVECLGKAKSNFEETKYAFECMDSGDEPTAESNCIDEDLRP